MALINEYIALDYVILDYSDGYRGMALINEYIALDYVILDIQWWL